MYIWDIEEDPKRYFKNNPVLSLFVPFKERKDPKVSFFLLVESLVDRHLMFQILISNGI